jgi:hypothetical protein
MTLVGEGFADNPTLDATAEVWEAGASSDELMAAVIWDFAGYLNEDVVTPRDFIIARERFIMDTRTGINSLTGDPLTGVIDAFPPAEYDSGYPPEIDAEFRKRSVDFARTVFGDSFADEALAFAARLIDTTDASTGSLQN